MSEHTNALSRRAFIGGATLLGVASLAAPSTALAATAAEKQAEADAVRNQLVGLQADLEGAEVNLGKAEAEQQAAQAAMEAEQAKIDETNGKIGDLQDKLGTRARSMYRSGSSSFLDFVLGAASFDEFSQNWDLMNKMNDNDSNMVGEAKTLREELQASKEEFAKQENIAAQKAAECKQIQDEVAAKVANAAVALQSLDAEARALLEEEQAAAARAAAAAAEAERARQQPINPSSNPSPGPNPGPSPSPSPSPGGGGGSVGGPYSSVVSAAYACIGTPYVWGGSTPGVGLDCSGLTQWCYAQVGIRISHQTESQYSQARNIVPVSQARPGDILYRYGHVGIAAGYGGMPYVHAPTFGAYVRDTDNLAWSNFTAALQF